MTYQDKERGTLALYHTKNYDRLRYMPYAQAIIPYQELLGNYDFQKIDNALRCIIPYQHNMRRIYHKFSPQVLQRPAGFVII